MSDRKGFILIELLMRGFTAFGLLVLAASITVQFAIAIPRVVESRQTAYYGAMRWDLENLVARQAIHFSESQSYSDESVALRFESSEGVTVTIAATPTGWWGTARHVALGPGEGCAVYHGATLSPSTPTRPARPGEPACTD